MPFDCQLVNLTVKLWTEEDWEEIRTTGTTIRGLLTMTLLICLYYRCLVFLHLTQKKRVNLPVSPLFTFRWGINVPGDWVASTPDNRL